MVEWRNSSRMAGRARVRILYWIGCPCRAWRECLDRAAQSGVRTEGGGGGGGTSAVRQGIALAAVLCCSGLAGTTGNRSCGGGTRQKTP